VGLPGSGQRLEVKGDKKNRVDFKPTSATVNNGVDAPKALTNIAGNICAPAWLQGRSDRPPADEMLACANGLLHIRSRKLYPSTPSGCRMSAMQSLQTSKPAPKVVIATRSRMSVSLATVENGTGAGESSALMKHWKNSIRVW
jgi:hypothetical protein